MKHLDADTPSDPHEEDSSRKGQQRQEKAEIKRAERGASEELNGALQSIRSSQVWVQVQEHVREERPSAEAMRRHRVQLLNNH